MLKVPLIIFCIFSYTFLFAQENNSKEQQSVLDDTHHVLSDYVYDISDSIDTILSGGFLKEKEVAKTNPLYKAEGSSIDSFFQTDKFRNETSQTYVRMRLESILQSKASDSTDLKVRAHLPLSKTKHTYRNFFKKSANNKDANSTKADDVSQNTFAFSSKYSLGASSFHPYVKARYFINFDLSSWSIHPAQTFRYSTKYKFEETTDLYFDRQISEKKLFRIQASRHTQQDNNGMDYSFALQYFQTLNSKNAINLTQSFWGNTKYKYLLSEPTYGGVSNYATSVNYRQNIWKKWFFYEVTSGVNFHRMYNYKPNYTAIFAIDVYFGRTYIR